MSRPRIGELFSGYGGLGMGVQSVYGGTIAWHSDIDKGACKILAHRYPDVPNHGDITAIKWMPTCHDCEQQMLRDDTHDLADYICVSCQARYTWEDVAEDGIPEPVDILTGGSPCQDLSHAGRRAGMTEGTRSNLWVAMREAIAQLRPSVVVWENVRGAYSAAADSEVEPCAGCVGDGSGVHLRALGRVLGDLSDLGYDCRWHGLRAADVGAPHGRFRVFVIARDANRKQQGPLGGVHGGSVAESSRVRGPLFRTPTSQLAINGGSQHPDKRKAGGHGPTLADEVEHLLPTPRTQNNENRQSEQFAGENGNFYGLLHNPDRWGDYAHAIARWESALGRSAPAPTMTSSKGNPQLSPAFVEFMMGLPAGWVDDVPGLTRNEKLKALGNGVVSQQCAEALRVMDSWSVAA